MTKKAGPPDGTVQETLDWVGSDPAKAQEALNAEQAKESPRATLVDALDPVIYDPDALYHFTGAYSMYYPGYTGQSETDVEPLPLNAEVGMDPVLITPAGGQDLPIPPRDGNWVPQSGKMVPKKTEDKGN